MAHMVKRETVDAARAEYGDDLAVVCYVNSTVESRAGATCASPAPTPSRSCPSCRSSTSCSFPTRTWAVSWPSRCRKSTSSLTTGDCPRHHIITVEQIVDATEAHPDALVGTPRVQGRRPCRGRLHRLHRRHHQVCRGVGRGSEFIIVTVRGVLYELERRCRGHRQEVRLPGGAAHLRQHGSHHARKARALPWRRARARCRSACRTRPPTRPSSRSTACSSTQRAKTM